MHMPTLKYIHENEMENGYVRMLYFTKVYPYNVILEGKDFPGQTADQKATILEGSSLM